eukprot:COSAG03_NODE_787_length_5862_cov_14.468680_8_plen_91_part_00
MDQIPPARYLQPLASTSEDGGGTQRPRGGAGAALALGLRACSPALVARCKLAAACKVERTSAVDPGVGTSTQSGAPGPWAVPVRAVNHVY